MLLEFAVAIGFGRYVLGVIRRSTILATVFELFVLLARVSVDVSTPTS